MTEAQKLERMMNTSMPKENDAKKLTKYTLASEIKQQYNELMRIRETSRAALTKIKSDRDYSDEYKMRLTEKVKAEQLEAQRHIYETASTAIRQLAQFVREDRPAEPFDLADAKFVSALSAIEKCGKKLLPETQALIVHQFRHCPDALKILKPLMESEGMQDGVNEITALQDAAVYENRYPDTLEDAFYFESRTLESNCNELLTAVNRVDGFVRASDTFTLIRMNPLRMALRASETMPSNPQHRIEIRATGCASISRSFVLSLNSTYLPNIQTAVLSDRAEAPYRPLCA